MYLAECNRGKERGTAEMPNSRRDFLQAAGCLLAAPRLAFAGELSCDIAVIGGGVGGCAAALAAARNGLHVILTGATDWVGGQLTSQAVTTAEHGWRDSFAA